MLNANQACKRLGITTSYLYKLMKDADVETFKIGGKRFYEEGSLKKFLKTFKRKQKGRLR